MKNETGADKEIVTQAHAARLRGVSRQAIHDLVKKGRLKVARNSQGDELAGMVYVSEVLNMEAAKRGRPRLTKDQLSARAKHGVSVGEPVIWLHNPRDAHGYRVAIPATVVGTGIKRVRVSFALGASDNEQATAWARVEDIRALYDLPYTADASDNEIQSKAVEILESIASEREAELAMERTGGLVGNGVV